MTKKIAIFEGQKIRRHWDEENEKWWFSVIDIIAVLTDSVNPRDYWFKMKIRVKTEGGLELSTICRQLKLEAPDGKLRETDCADTQTIFRIIQSIPSPKAEPFKQWLARVGYERVEESEDPEKAIQRAMNFYLKRGYSKNWINQRLKSIEIRKELTDEWENRGVSKNDEFAILTDEIRTSRFAREPCGPRPPIGGLRAYTFAWAELPAPPDGNWKKERAKKLSAH